MQPFGIIGGYDDPEIGLRLYEEAVSSGESMSNETVILCAYGLYLSNGGRKDDFLDLNMQDIQIMMSTQRALKARDLVLQSKSDLEM